MVSLRLINLNDTALATLLEGVERFERRYHVQTGGNRLLVHEISLLTQRLMEHSGSSARWGGYLAVDEQTGIVVGACAFKGKPSEEGEVEIGYFTFAEFEGQGCGTSMAQALIAIAIAAAEVTRVVANTQPEESASTRILRKVGMAFEGERHDPVDGVIWRWSLIADR